MKRRYEVEYSRIVYYAPVEIEAQTEEEALELLQEMADKGDLQEDDVEDNSEDIIDMGEIEQ